MKMKMKMKIKMKLFEGIYSQFNQSANQNSTGYLSGTESPIQTYNSLTKKNERRRNKLQ